MGTENEVKHTPTPWHTNLEFDGRHRYFPIMAPWAGCDDETNYHPLIAMTKHGTGDAPQEVAKANASHIVKCVNLHDELVDFLQELEDLLSVKDPKFHGNPTAHNEACKANRVKLKALLAKARSAGEA